MDCIVLVKQVPDTQEVKMDPKTGTLIREGIQTIINPDDLHALEEALALKEKHGGKVIAISMGPPQAVEALAEAIAMGADEAILLSDRAFAGADTWATSHTLGKCIQKLGRFDLILCGRQAIDGDTAQIGPQVAEMLGIPQITYVRSLSIVGPKVIAERVMEDGFERLEASLPALVTVLRDLNKPRYPTIPGLILACSSQAKIHFWNPADIGVKAQEIGLDGSLTHVVKTFPPAKKKEGETFQGSTGEVVEQLVDRLKEIHIL
jgi:electron transfer flavoprotein alpha/beta subunit